MTPDPERNADGTAPRPVAPRSKRAHRRPWDKDAPACGSSRLRTTAIALAWIPLPGLVLSYVFCWGHPLSALGPSVLAIGAPAAFVTSLAAFAWSPHRSGLFAALVASFVEVLIMISVLLGAVG